MDRFPRIEGICLYPKFVDPLEVGETAPLNQPIFRQVELHAQLGTVLELMEDFQTGLRWQDVQANQNGPDDFWMDFPFDF